MPADEILHELPMRWADLDSLNHVNNVVYLDYAAESRARLVDDGVVGDDDGIARMAVRFLRPMLLTREPVVVVSSTGPDELSQAVCLVGDGERTTFAEVVTTYGARQDATPRADVPTMSMTIRRSDLDERGAVRPTKVFELFQEARVFTISTHLSALTPGSFVVGSSDVTFRRPVVRRAEPCTASVWVERVGRASFHVRSELVDGATVLADATTVLVGFDPVAQRSRPFGDLERSQLAGLIPPS